MDEEKGTVTVQRDRFELPEGALDGWPGYRFDESALAFERDPAGKVMTFKRRAYSNGHGMDGQHFWTNGRANFHPGVRVVSDRWDH